jgi:hypothetical protein
LGVCALALASLSAWPQTPELQAERVEFVVGNAYFVLMHEVAHMVLNEFDIPVLGNEEEAADTLAATTLIRLDKLSGTDEFRFTRMLIMAGDANRILWKRGIEMQAGKNAYWANHPLSVQRATRIACLVYGSNTDVFVGLPELVDIPFFRASWCEEEYASAEKGRQWVRDNVKQPKRLRKGGNVSVAYDDPADETHAFIQRWLQQEKILENSARYVSDNFRMPEDVSFTAMSCGAPNAFWDTEERSVILCYELLAAFYKLGAEQQVQELEVRLRNMASKD